MRQVGIVIAPHGKALAGGEERLHGRDELGFNAFNGLGWGVDEKKESSSSRKSRNEYILAAADDPCLVSRGEVLDEGVLLGEAHHRETLRAQRTKRTFTGGKNEKKEGEKEKKKKEKKGLLLIQKHFRLLLVGGDAVEEGDGEARERSLQAEIISIKFENK